MRNKGQFTACIVTSLVVILGVLASTVGCAKSTPTATTTPTPTASPKPTAAPTPAATPTPTASPKPTSTPTAAAPIRLVYHNYGPRAPAEETAVWVMEELAKRSGGRIKSEIMFGGPLGDAQAQLSNMGKGMFDTGSIIPGYHPSELQLTGIVIVPSLPNSTFIPKLYAQHKLLTEQKDVVAELAKYNIREFAPSSMPNYEIISVKPIAAAADLKGLQIRGYGPMDPVLKNLGATPLSMVFPEAYTAMQRGTIDGVLGSYPDTQFRYKLYEVGKFLTRNMGFGPIGYTCMINLQKYNSLPDDIKKIVNDLGTEVIEKKWRQIRTEEDQKADATLVQYKVKINEWSAVERGKIEAEAVASQQSWVKDLAAKGLPAQKVLDDFKAYLKEFAAK